MLTFPNNPTLNDLWPDPPVDGHQWQWDGVRWLFRAPPTDPADAHIVVAPMPPLAPARNTFWWSSTDGRLYVYYDDSNSEQWVQINIKGDTGPQGPVGGNFPDVAHDGIAYLRKDAQWIPMTYVTGTINASVAIPAVANQFVDGPSINVGNEGTWFVSGHITCGATSGAAGFLVRLHDGTTVITDTQATSGNANWPISMAVSGVIENPNGALRLSVCQVGTTTGATIFFDRYSTLPNVNTRITALRIG